MASLIADYEQALREWRSCETTFVVFGRINGSVLSRGGVLSLSELNTISVSSLQ